MSKPTTSIFPIENGKLITPLDCNNLQLINLDESNLSGGGGSGAAHTVSFVGSVSADVITADQAVFLADDLGATIAGGSLSANTFIVLVTSSTVVQISESVADELGVTFSFDRLATAGNDTGTTTAILKGDGDHGFADAVADTDYASVGSVQLKEDATTHNAEMLVVTTDITAINGQITTINTTLAGKADTTTVNAALALKADASALTAYITSNDAAVALKANSSDVTTALALKADAADLTAGLALKEDLLPTSSNDGFVLVRDADETWHFVDPITLGSTNATYTDGHEFSNTTFTSATAAFTTNDTGLIIVSADIPDGTTITYVSATTVTLSAAATATATGVTFTLLNRYLLTSGGTVTSVGSDSGSGGAAVTDLMTISVTNPTTSAVTHFVKPTTTLGNNFYGNPNSTTGFASFMTAAQARTSLGGTTVGQAIFQLTNPSQVGFVQTNANNTVTALAAAATLTAIGGEKVLTFNSPLTRIGTNQDTINIPAADNTKAGHLTAADWITFNAKASGSTTITTTAPLRIDGSGSANLSASRTIAMPAATASVDGYLTSGDFANFTAKPPNVRTIATTAPLTGGGDLSANRTLAIPKATISVDGYLAAADFLNFTNTAPIASTASTSGTYTVPVVTPPINRVVLGQPLSGPLTIVLPPAANYGGAGGYIEIVDLVSGGAQSLNKTITLTRSGSDLVDAVVSVPLSVAAGYTRLTSNGLSSGGRWITTKYFVDGFRDALDPGKQARVDVSSLTAGSPRILKIAKDADSVTVVPNTGNVNDGSFIYDYDTNGQALRASPGTGLPAIGSEGQVLTVVSGTPTWAGGASVFSYVPLTDAATITWACIPNQRTQNAYVSLSGNRTLNITGAQSGMHFNLFVLQGTGSNTLALPTGSLTPTNGLGLITLSSAIGSCDLVEGDHVGTTRIPYGWHVTALNMTGAAPPSCSVLGAQGATTGTAIILGNTAQHTYTSFNFNASGTAICRIDINLQRVLSPNFTMQAGIYTDVARSNGVTSATGVTIAGQSLVTCTASGGAPNWTTADLGTRVTFSAGFGAGPFYISAVNSTTSINVSQDQAGTTPALATSGLTNVVVTTFGSPGTIIGDWSTNTLSSASVPTALSGTGSADDTPQSFTGVTATGLTNAAAYHVVLRYNGTPDATNYLNLLYNTTSDSTTRGYNIKDSQLGSVWTQRSAAHKSRFSTYHT